MISSRIHLLVSRITLMTLIAMVLAATRLRRRHGRGGFDLSWHTVDGGGGTSTGGNFTLTGTIGQHAHAGAPMTGGGFSVTGGFWAIDITPGPITCLGDLDNNNQVNGIDLGILLNQWLTDGTADFNNDNTVNGIDLGILLNAWVPAN